MIKNSNCASEPCVWAILVTHEGSGWIRQCLKSLLLNGVTNIVVLDNASTDDTVEIITNDYPEAILVRNATNLGFGRANNLGIQIALDKAATHVLLVNQDIVFQDDAVKLLLSAMQEDPSLGLLSAFQLSYEGSSIDGAFRNYMPPSFIDDLYFGRRKALYETDFMPAASVLIRREALLSIGGFDPLFFLYGEDDDLCLRLRNAGWKIGVVPAALVQHWHGILHKKRDMKWRLNFAFTGGIRWLKNNPRSLFVAYFTLAWNWFVNVDPQEILIRVAAFTKCLMKYPAILAHRGAKPFSFTIQGADAKFPCASEGIRKVGISTNESECDGRTNASARQPETHFLAH
jgi:GT2 family glycosyltransferase